MGELPNIILVYLLPTLKFVFECVLRSLSSIHDVAFCELQHRVDRLDRVLNSPLVFIYKDVFKKPRSH